MIYYFHDLIETKCNAESERAYINHNVEMPICLVFLPYVGTTAIITHFALLILPFLTSSKNFLILKEAVSAMVVVVPLQFLHEIFPRKTRSLNCL